MDSLPEYGGSVPHLRNFIFVIIFGVIGFLIVIVDQFGPELEHLTPAHLDAVGTDEEQGGEVTTPEITSKHYMPTVLRHKTLQRHSGSAALLPPAGQYSEITGLQKIRYRL